MNQSTALKLNALTSSRFFAAAVIVLYHAANSAYSNPFLAKPPLYLSVSYFFVLSGFILTHVYQDLEASGLKSFFVHRFARVWPLHIFTLILSSVLFPVKLRSLTHSVITWPIIFLNALMLQSWLPFERVFFSLNSVSWSISTEVGFYLLFPLILPALKRRRLSICLIALLSIGLAFMFDKLGFQHAVNDFSLMTNPLIRLVEFAGGIGFYFIYQKLKTRVTFFQVSLVQVLSLLAIPFVLLHELPLSPSSVLTLIQEDVYIPVWGITIIFLALDGMVSKLLSYKWLVLLGEISFSMYLLHTTLLKMNMPLFIFPFVLLFASWLSFRFIETPARNLVIQRAKSVGII